MSISPDSDADSSLSSLPSETLKSALELWARAGEVHDISLRGSSMLPLLRDGDRVRVSHRFKAIHSGDIVVFQRSDGLTAHRVLRVAVHKTRRTLRTKGDNALGLDPEMPEAELIGRVQAVWRGDRQMIIDTPAWRAAGRVIAGVMLAQAWLYHKSGRGEGKLPERFPFLLSRGILRLGAMLINACQAVLGRWQREGDNITC